MQRARRWRRLVVESGDDRRPNCAVLEIFFDGAGLVGASWFGRPAVFAAHARKNKMAPARVAAWYN